MKKYKRRVKWYGAKPSNLSQAISSGPEFSFLSDKNEQISQFCLCRDFLQDAMHGSVNGKKMTIYGFEFNPKNNPHPCRKAMKMAVGNSSDHKLRDKIPNCLDLLNQFEKSIGLMLTKVREASDPPVKYVQGGVWVFEGDSAWTRSGPMISLYTLLIRIGFGHRIGAPFLQELKDIASGKIEPYQPVDRGRIAGAIPGIERIMQQGWRKIFGTDIKKNYPKKVAVGAMHGYFGIMAFSSNLTKTYMPSWYD